MDKEKIKSIIIETINELKDELNTKTELIIKDETILYGENGLVDSLGLVSIISSVESEVSSRFNKEIVIADERAMSQRSSPFRTINSLTDYVFNLLTNSNL